VDQSEPGLRVHASDALDPNQPVYKPEFWDKVVALDEWTNRDDPVMTCLPLDWSARTALADLRHRERTYLPLQGWARGGGRLAEFRMIPLDGRPRDPQRALDPTYYGYTIGTWEGDTLVLDSIFDSR